MSPVRAALLFCSLLAGAILAPSPSSAARPVSPPALAPLPPPPSPPENPTTPEKVALGKNLFFDRGGGGDPKKSPMLRPLGLSREEKESLREFLATGLSGRMPESRSPVLP